MKNSYRNLLLPAIFIGVLSGCQLDLETAIILDDRNKFTGRYEVEEYSEIESATFFYDMEIWKSRYPDDIIWVGNFYDADITVFAEVDGNRLYIPYQRINNLEIEGRGTYFGGGELSITYSVREILPGPDYIDFLSSSAWRYY